MTGDFIRQYGSGNIGKAEHQGSGNIVAGGGGPTDRPRRRAAGRFDPLIFVNYRGTDEAWAANAVSKVWTEHVGAHRSFLDNRSIRPGIPFDEELLNAVKASAVLFAVIGRQWYGVQPDGHRLIDNQDDWVRREIVHAIQHHVHVIPVLVDDSQLVARELPPDLRPIVKFQYRTISHRSSDSDLAGMVDYVYDAVERVAEAMDGYR